MWIKSINLIQFNTSWVKIKVREKNWNNKENQEEFTKLERKEEKKTPRRRPYNQFSSPENMFPDSSARRSFKTEQNFTDLKSEMSGKFLTAYKEKQRSYPY